MMPDDIAEVLAKGECPVVDNVGTNAQDAGIYARSIVVNHDDMVPVLIALITKIQEQTKSIEMFEYTQCWRKRRP